MKDVAEFFVVMAAAILIAAPVTLLMVWGFGTKN